MASTAFNGNEYRMGPRIRMRDAELTPDAVVLETPAPVVVPRDECQSGNANLCEKPQAANSMTLPIVLGIAIPVVLAIVVLFFLHKRNVRKQRREEAADPNKDLDFGLDSDVSGGQGSKRKSAFREKVMRSDSKHRAQISMDMNLSSPYLLPPGLQGSRESLHSLARNLHNEDPYRVNQYGSEVGSVRSFHPDGKEGRSGSSTYAGSTGRQSSGPGRPLPARQASLPKPPAPTADPFGTPTSSTHQPDFPLPTPTSPPRKPLAQPIFPEIGTVPYPDEEDMGRIPDVPDVPQPPPAAARPPRIGVSGSSSPPPGPLSPGYRQDTSSGAPMLPEFGSALSGLEGMSGFSSPVDSRSPPPSAPLPTIIPEENRPSGDEYEQADYHDYEYEERGRPAQRRSLEGNDFRNSQALGVPQQDSRRLSVGLRPLPPNEATESEDPEERANRIRSFYKEYFDDSKPGEAGPPLGAGPGAGQGAGQGAPPPGPPSYYEDYDAGYSGAESAFYDPDSNAFVMPYAQPVTRRAMTPPPSGSRHRGPPPPRAMHGSMGGMNMPGGGRRPPGPPRAGTSMSNNRWGPPSRPGSSLSSSYGPLRPGSSISNQAQRQAKPQGPPPSALSTLPNPSKLKDDSFAIFNATDFAPPESYEDRQRGRSQSPSGERRPYAVKKPVASPLVSSFDEMAVVPSPHLLRKSGTFTGLDFAPPRRFVNEDVMSDAGSIRSNRSGLSAANAHAIRSGAGRVSRLPDDTVFTQASLQSTLKPSWGLRDT